MSEGNMIQRTKGGKSNPTYLSKFSSGLSRSETITGIVSLNVIEDFEAHRYSIC